MDSFMELVKEFLGSKWAVYSLYVYLGLLVFYCTYSVVNYFKYYSKMQQNIKSFYAQMGNKERLRAQLEQKERDIHGKGVKKDLLSSIDEDLAYSGIKNTFPWITTELYIFITCGIALILGAAVTIFTTWIYGVVVIIITVITFNTIIIIMGSRQEQKIEKILLQFMNIVDNFSKTSDDLITILDRTSKYIDEPLATIIAESVVEARNTGDSMLALQHLQDKVKTQHFKILMRNLEITSRFETNYSDIIADCRGIFHEYLKSEKEKRSMRLSGLLEIIVMILTGFACIWIINDVTDSGNIFQLFLHMGLKGYLALGFLGFSLLAALYIGIFKILRKK